VQEGSVGEFVNKLKGLLVLTPKSEQDKLCSWLTDKFPDIPIDIPTAVKKRKESPSGSDNNSKRPRDNKSGSPSTVSGAPNFGLQNVDTHKAVPEVLSIAAIFQHVKEMTDNQMIVAAMCQALEVDGAVKGEFLKKKEALLAEQQSACVGMLEYVLPKIELIQNMLGLDIDNISAAQLAHIGRSMRSCAFQVQTVDMNHRIKPLDDAGSMNTSGADKAGTKRASPDGANQAFPKRQKQDEPKRDEAWKMLFKQWSDNIAKFVTKADLHATLSGVGVPGSDWRTSFKVLYDIVQKPTIDLNMDMQVPHNGGTTTLRAYLLDKHPTLVL